MTIRLPFGRSRHGAKTYTAAAAMLLMVSPALAYNVTISSDPTSNGTLTASSFKATGPDAVLNYQDLQNALAASNFLVKTGTRGSQAGDITVAHKITWAANTLTLDAYHSIVVSKSVLPTSTAGLSFTFRDGGPSDGDLIFSGPGNATFMSTAQILTINSVPYTLVDGVRTLATDISGNPTGNFALAFSETEPTGFTSTPVTTTFGGNFEALGNTISALQIHTSASPTTAMFASLSSIATVKDLTLSGVDIQSNYSGTADVAALAVSNAGRISNVVSTGSVQNTSSSASAYVAGLVDFNNSPGVIVNSHSTATIAATRSFDLGGLVAINSSTLTQDYATGDVSSTVTSATAGGLVGFNVTAGTVTLCFAKGGLSAPGGVLGGLIGSNEGTIDQAYAVGDLNSSGGIATAGGLFGTNSGTVTDTYSRGSVVGQNGTTMGGFVGSTTSTSNIATSYSTGAPSGGTTIGGFAGSNNSAATSTSLYWNTTTSNVMQATGNGNDTGITGLTTGQMRSGLPAGFDSMIWTEQTGVNSGFPYLINLSP